MLDRRTPRKRAVNLFVDADLLDEAKRMRVNLSEVLEQRLNMIVRREREGRWLKENRAALEAYNRRVEEHGLLSDQAGLL
jgi:antitoxin CcdA